MMTTLSFPICDHEPRRHGEHRALFSPRLRASVARGLRLKSPVREEIHRERRGERGDLDQVPRLLTDLSPKLNPLAVTADGIDQSAHDRPSYTGPVRDLFDEIRRVLAHNIGRGPRFLALSG